MGKKSAEKKAKREGRFSSTDKGKIVEEIVASMHDLAGVQVESRVFLPSLNTPKRKREIDVLLSGMIAGYPFRYAIECKNEKTVIGVEKIDSFLGKLEDIGIPPQYGIFVSSSGYTKGAVSRAVNAGLRPLVLTGLTKVGFVNTVKEAIQSIVYLLLAVESFSVTNQVAKAQYPHQMFLLFDEQGNPRGQLVDLIWQEWSQGKIPAVLGMHDSKFAVPENWKSIVNQKPEPILSFEATYRVIALVVKFEGEVNRHNLINASSNQVEKNRLTATFRATSQAVPVSQAYSEEELNAVLAETKLVAITLGRLRLPRILVHFPKISVYWPPSEKIVRKLAQGLHGMSEQEIMDLPPLSLEETEGLSLSAVFDPIWENYPVRPPSKESTLQSDN